MDAMKIETYIKFNYGKSKAFLIGVIKVHDSLLFGHVSVALLASEQQICI
jgi:hypothetical protein